MPTLSIDIETYSDTDLKKSGVYKYTESPEFEILLFAYCLDGGPISIFEGDEIPDRVIAMLTDPAILKTAHNASFERTCLAKYFGVPMPPEQWQCTMVKSSMLGLPLSLEAVASVLRLKDQKDTVGKQLIKYFCTPCTPTKTNGGRTRNRSFHAPDKWKAFMDYCVQDVRVEQAIRDKIAWFEMPEDENKLWYLDQHINDRGVMLDMRLVKQALSIDAINRKRLTEEAIQLTGLSNPNSRNQLINWLTAEMDQDAIGTLKKEDIPEYLKKTDAYANKKTLDRMLTIRQEMAKTSIKKYAAMTKCICADGRVRGLFQFYGANRTGRFAGRLSQPHNLPRIDYKDSCLEIARNLVIEDNAAELEMLFGNVPDMLSQLLRTAFIAEDGNELLVADFASIEARITAWLANEKWRLDVFNTHGKIYEASASAMFHFPLDDYKGPDGKFMESDHLPKHLKEFRQRGKVAELALGYQGGPNALLSMDKGKKLKEEELQPIVTAWRKASPNIVQLWYDTQDAAITAVETGEHQFLHHGISYFVSHGILFCQLPSGRCIAYMRPKVKKEMCTFVTFNEDHGQYKKAQKALINTRLANDYFKHSVVTLGGEKEKKSLSYEGLIQKTNKWGTIHTYGGSLVENNVQAIARDCLAVAMLAMDKTGYDIPLHVHDEIVSEALKGTKNIKDIYKIMTSPIPWAPGLPLGADGFVNSYYKK